ncbi:MAG: putative RND superfamily exporter protein [Bradymonadia bacterium]|jgi:predicted RND superfamily exporter protein
MTDLRVLAGLALAIGLLCLGVLPAQPTVDNSVSSWLDPARPSVRAYCEFRRVFGSDEVYVVQLSGSRDAMLRHARAFEAIFTSDPLIQNVLGPGTVFEDEVEVLLDSELADPVTVAGMRLDTPLNGRLSILRLSPPRALIFALGRVAPPHAREPLDAALEAARGAAKRQGVTVRIAGNPALNLALDRAGRAVQTQSLPLLVGVCVVLLIVATRSVILSLATLPCVGLAMLAAQGALGWTGLPSNLVVSIAQPLVFVLLLASAMHVLTAWQDARRAGRSATDAPWDAVRHKGPAIAMAVGTTAVGFATLAVADLRPVQTFGLLAAGGLLGGLGAVLLCLPALLSVVGRYAHVRSEGAADRWAQWAVRFGLRHRAVVVTIGVLILGAGVAAFPALRTDPHAIRYFAADHPLRRDHEVIEETGLGLSTVEVVLTAANSLLTPERLDAVDAFADTLATLPGVQRIVGATVLLRDANVRAGGIDAMPAGPIVEEARAANGANQFISPDGKALRITLLIATLDDAGLAAIRTGVEAAAQPLAGVTVSVTGNYGLLLEAQRGLLSTLTTSLLLTALLIELLILVALRDLRLAAAALLPNAAPIAVNFVVMMALDIPLDVGTCMTAAVALGIAVDDTLHVLMAWQADARTVARSTGRALVWTTAIIGAGFLTLLGADFGPTRNFGLLCATAMLTAVIADLVLLPALLGPSADAAET